MARKNAVTGVVVLALCLVLAGSVFGRMKLDADEFKDFQGGMAAGLPIPCVAAHRIGKIVLAVSTSGTFGTGFASNIEAGTSDCFTNDFVPSCEYPKRSNVEYLFAGAIWIGAVVGRDTLVSVGADGWWATTEMFPDDGALSWLKGVKGQGLMLKRSIIDPTAPEFDGAISEEDYVTVYTDTFTSSSNPPKVVDPDFFGRPHTPLHIQVKEESYAWSYEYAEDFVLFDYQITNVGQRALENVYMGIYVDADVCFDCDGTEGFRDDICGFTHTMTRDYEGCKYLDTVNVAWIADNDGDFGLDPFQRTPHVTATRIVRTPATKLDVSFNWWISNGSGPLDFGPREKEFKGRWKEPWRDLGTGGVGTPEGDLNKYYFLRNREFDYSQCSTCVIPENDTLWINPRTNPEACGFADGYDTRYLLSFGPFTIDPGEQLPISLAYLAGENFHTNAGNIGNLPNDPEAFYEGLNFDDLSTNSVWASWIYDNPGVDTDKDGYFGEFRVCVKSTEVVDSICDTISDTCIYITDTTRADTIWYKGDGVPDFRGASPPPAPDLWIESTVGSLRIRFNGTRSETTKDVFSGEVDFEGYRIHIARDERSSSYSVVTSYDVEDYNKYVYDSADGLYVLKDVPFTLEQLRTLYGINNPLTYTVNFPFVHPQYADSLFYFTPQDYNQSELGLPDGIRKVYPDQPYPSSVNPDSARPEELTEDGNLKYFEYEYVINNLLSTVPYWVNITAFDFGSPASGLPSLETSVTVGAKHAYPLSSADEVAQKDLEVFVYPNPYRIDGKYKELGFEGRNPALLQSDDRLRRINFANVPAKCTIRIYTLDGDLVREIVHDMDPSDPNASHEVWDMITRNTQLVVSGLYYWTVEAEDGKTQIGKLVIIM